MTNLKVTIVAGARPNFMKIAPIIRAIQCTSNQAVALKYRLIHTGQHYDSKMSGDFFAELNIPNPDTNLEAGGGSQAEQTAAIMVGFERELLLNPPGVVLVVGDVTSTMACTITAKKLGIEVVHVEAGIRSGDLSMPEEINRIVTDSICDHFFTTTEVAGQNLSNIGIEPGRIHFVGNTMIDTLYQNLYRLRKPQLWDQYRLESRNYFLMTLHRPSNVDNSQGLTRLLDVILKEVEDHPIVFPVHPRTRKTVDPKFFNDSRIILTEPLGYLEFIFLVQNARAVITDSGGITEETTVLQVPCLTLRNTTERPETVTIGSNVLVGTNPTDIIPYLQSLKNNTWKTSSIPARWDGKTSSRIINKLMELYC